MQKKDTIMCPIHYSATRIRTWKCWNQNPVPYHLAIALHCDSKRIKRGQEDSNPRPFGP